MKKTTLLVAIILAATCCSKASYNVVATDALIKIFPSDTDYTPAPAPLELAAGENASFQFVVWDDTRDLNDVKIESVTLSCNSMKVRTTGFIAYVQSVLDYEMRDPDALLPDDRRYPDPIITDSTLFIPKGERRCFWVDIDVPALIPEGEYTAKVKFSAKEGKLSCTQTIKVYPVSIEGQKLLVTNWMWLRPEYTNDGVNVTEDSTLWWDWYGNLVELASDYGNNAWRLDVVNVGSTPDGKNFTFDFSRFDKFVDLIQERGNLAMIHGEHFGGRDGWVAPFTFHCPYLDGSGKIKYKRAKYTDPQMKKFIDAYFPVLVQHLKELKLRDGRCALDIYAQFIADEPIAYNIDGWEGFAKMIKNAAPEIKIIEAYRTNKWDRSLLDYPCPQEDELFWHDCFHNLDRSDNVWMYTCMYPREKYPNRFLDQLLIKTRLVHWVNYDKNCIGYLHWGFNYWPGPVAYWAKQGEKETPFGKVSTGEWPGGDSHIIYPGYHKYYPSIRLCAMRDGIRDYELLRMLEEKDSTLARELSGKVMHDLQDYETDVPFFRSVRHEILENLSKQ